MDTAQKLCILHLLDIYKEPMDMGSLSDILVGLNIFQPLEIDIILGELVKSGLIKASDKGISLEDEGLVILEFFRDRIDLDLQKKIQNAAQKNKPLGRWQVDYNRMTSRLFLNYFREDERLLAMDFSLEASAYELIKDNLEKLNDEKFSELKRFFLNAKD